MHPYVAEQLFAHRRSQLLEEARRSHLQRLARCRAPGRRWPALPVALVLSAALMVAQGTAGSEVPPAHVPANSGQALAGFASGGSERVVYAPGESRTWAPTRGLHTVVVLSGRLTIRASDGRHRSYSQGEAFAAGWEHYTAVNEGSTTVESVVTRQLAP